MTFTIVMLSSPITFTFSPFKPVESIFCMVQLTLGWYTTYKVNLSSQLKPVETISLTFTIVMLLSSPIMFTYIVH